MTDESQRVRWERMEALWDKLRTLPSAERDDLLASVGAEDPELGSELEALLAGSSNAEPFFTQFASIVEAGADEALMRKQFDQLEAALAGHYTVEREIGRGGMACVYLARDLRHGREVALKVLDPALTAALGVDRFLREIEIAAGLRHPHVLPLYDSGEAASFLYYVMPYEPGRSLRERLVRDGPLPMEDALRILHDIVDALAYAHEHGIVHCDIKPENILLSARHATVADFGVARAIAQASRDSPGDAPPTAVGTPRYMAPEQASGTGEVDHRADIYAVGVLAWEMLAGRPPFTGDTPEAVLAAHMTQQPEPLTAHRPDVPPALAELVMKCLEKRPADRWQRADEMFAHLETLRLPAENAQVGTLPQASGAPVRRARLKRGVLAGTIIVMLAVLPWTLRRMVGAQADAARAARETAAGPGPGSRGLLKAGTTDPAAQELYRLATDDRVFRTDSAAREALARLQQAVALDPAFADAWAALAQMYLRVPPREAPEMPLSERLAIAQRHALRGLSLNDSLANAHRALGNIFLRDYRFADAERHLQLAIRLDPGEALGREALVRLYVFTGRLGDALDAGRAAVELDPLTPAHYAEYARALLVNGRCDLAREQLERIANVEPRVGRERLIAAQCYALEGKWQDAIAEFAEPPGLEGRMMLGYLYAQSGQTDRARAVLEQFRTNSASWGAFGVAAVHAGLREYDQAFIWLERSITDRSLRWDIMEPIYADLRADPRFDELMRRIGLQNR